MTTSPGRGIVALGHCLVRLCPTRCSKIPEGFVIPLFAHVNPGDVVEDQCRQSKSVGWRQWLDGAMVEVHYCHGDSSELGRRTIVRDNSPNVPMVITSECQQTGKQLDGYI